jgi:hypothetical protein
MLSCAECRIGRLQATQATYLQPLRTQILVFPHAPASRCDVCGALAFDTFFTDMMEALIADHLEDEPAGMLLQSLLFGVAGYGSSRFKMM